MEGRWIGGVCMQTQTTSDIEKAKEETQNTEMQCGIDAIGKWEAERQNLYVHVSVVYVLQHRALIMILRW